jgi:ketosteroid isomerase-like protein
MSITNRVDSEIDQLYKRWVQAFQLKSPEAILDLLTPDYVLWPAGAPAMNRDSVGLRLVATLSAYDVTPSFEREERLVSGDFAFERGWDVQEVRPRSGGETKTHRQRVFLVLHRGADGRWRFARGMSQPGPAAA